MSAPRTPAEARGGWRTIGEDLDRRYLALARHHHGDDVAPEEVAEHALALLAQGRYLQQSLDAHVTTWALAAVRAGVPVPEVAAATEWTVAKLTAELLAEVRLLELVHQRPGTTSGMDPVVAEQVRALINGADR